MKRMMRTAFVVAVLAVLAVPQVSATMWDIDSSHASASFSVKHLMISTVRGDFGGVKGTIEWDGKDPASLKIDATVDVSTVDTGDPKRDEHLKSPDFFDVAKFSTMTFKSKSATSVGNGKLKVVGDLTLRGKTKEVTLDVDGPTAEVKDPWGNTRVGASATAKINRQDFGVAWNKTLDAGGVVVSDDVNVTIDLEVRKRPEEAKK